jgi:hypothetical protein
MIVASVAQMPMQNTTSAAQTARWILNRASWGYLTTIDASDASTGGPAAQVTSYSDGQVDVSTGRFFFYLMGGQAMPAALTVSEAAFNGSCGFAGSAVDPEDPRCGKITLTGSLVESEGKDIETGKAALFARHPQMKTWPASHQFTVYELKLKDIWMIDWYGGGVGVTVADLLAATPRDSRPKWPPHVGHAVFGTKEPPPPWKDTAARARWLAAHATWAALSTTSVHLKGSPWANVRSVADGIGINSTGLPYFYVPTPDPSHVDIDADSHVVLSLSEAALSERAGPDGTKACGGMDAEDPTCARLHLVGVAVKASPKAVDAAKAAFKAKHPHAPWLAAGGAHTGGDYYTLELQSIEFLDFYGGPAKLSVADYLAAKRGGAMRTHSVEQPQESFGQESFCQKVAANGGCCPACGYSWDFTQAKCVTAQPASTAYCKLLTKPEHGGCCVFCGHVWSSSEGRCVGGM